MSIANPDMVTVSLTVCDDKGVKIDRTGGVTSFSRESSLLTVTAIEGMSVEFPSSSVIVAYITCSSSSEA